MEGAAPGRHVAVPVQRAPVQHDRARERHFQIREHSMPRRRSYRTLLWQDRVCMTHSQMLGKVEYGLPAKI